MARLWRRSAPPKLLTIDEASVQPVPAKRPRLASLDQFRGYTVAGMVFVNFLGSYDAWMPPVLLHHHTYCSYADTIMPHFLFAVGFAMRLSFGRHVRDEGLVAGYWRMVRRIVGLFLVSFAIYTSGRAVENWHELVGRGTWDVVSPYLKREWLQTLGHIAITSLWILPVIRSQPESGLLTRSFPGRPMSPYRTGSITTGSIRIPTASTGGRLAF